MTHKTTDYSVSAYGDDDDGCVQNRDHDLRDVTINGDVIVVFVTSLIGSAPDRKSSLEAVDDSLLTFRVAVAQSAVVSLTGNPISSWVQDLFAVPAAAAAAAAAAEVDEEEAGNDVTFDVAMASYDSLTSSSRTDIFKLCEDTLAYKRWNYIFSHFFSAVFVCRLSPIMLLKTAYLEEIN